MDKDNAAFERFGMLGRLQDTCKVCKMCSLGWDKIVRGSSSYDPHVFSNYDDLTVPPKFMIIGQNPGWNEIVLSKPFVGKAGANFDSYLQNSIWNRNNFYITNAVKCYAANGFGDESLRMCESFLRMEISVVKPVLVIAFGDVVFGVLCDGDFHDSIGKVVNSDKFGVKVFTTYYPSSINLADRSKAKQFRKDMAMLCKIMDYHLSPF